MSKQSFERKLEEIDALRSAPAEAAEAQLRKALRDRNNYAVSRAANVIRERQARALLPDLLDAFDRFFVDPAKTDPQCWAKNALVRALKDLDHTDAAVYLRGISHVQMEPAFGGAVDSAGTLRGASAMALTACPMGTFEVLFQIANLLFDSEKPVRIDAVRAIAHLGAQEGAIALRIKALAGDSEPEVTGCCFAGLLSLMPEHSVLFVALFLDSKDPDVVAEAAAALSDCPHPEALSRLREFWSRQVDWEVKRALLRIWGGSVQQSAAAFLFVLAEREPETTAVAALQALAAGKFWKEYRERAIALAAERGITLQG